MSTVPASPPCFVCTVAQKIYERKSAPEKWADLLAAVSRDQLVEVVVEKSKDWAHTSCVSRWMTSETTYAKVRLEKKLTHVGNLPVEVYLLFQKLEKGKELTDTERGQGFFSAAEIGDLEKVKAFSKKGAIPVVFYEEAMRVAAVPKKAKIFEFLVDNEKSLLAKGNDGVVPVPDYSKALLAAAQIGCLPMVTYLLKERHGFSAESLKEPFFAAVESNHVAMVNLFIGHQACHSWLGSAALKAIQGGCFSVASLLIPKLELEDYYRAFLSAGAKTPQNNNFSLFRSFLKKKIPENVLGQALWLLIGQGEYKEAVRLLNFNPAEAHRIRGFEIAYEKYQVHLMQMLLQRSLVGIFPAKPSLEGKPAKWLLQRERVWAALKEEDSQLVISILAEGALTLQDARMVLIEAARTRQCLVLMALRNQPGIKADDWARALAIYIEANISAISHPDCLEEEFKSSKRGKKPSASKEQELQLLEAVRNNQPITFRSLTEKYEISSQGLERARLLLASVISQGQYEYIREAEKEILDQINLLNLYLNQRSAELEKTSPVNKKNLEEEFGDFCDVEVPEPPELSPEEETLLHQRVFLLAEILELQKAIHGLEEEHHELIDTIGQKAHALFTSAQEAFFPHPPQKIDFAMSRDIEKQYTDKDPDRGEAVLKAVQNKEMGEFQRLLRIGGIPDDIRGKALLRAVENGCFGMVDWLLDVPIERGYYDQAFQHAFELRNIPIMAELVARGDLTFENHKEFEKVFAIRTRGKEVMYEFSRGNLTKAEEILEQGPINHDAVRLLLLLACQRGALGVLKMIEEKNPIAGDEYSQAVVYACKNGQFDTAEHLLEMGGVSEEHLEIVLPLAERAERKSLVTLLKNQRPIVRFKGIEEIKRVEEKPTRSRSSSRSSPEEEHKSDSMERRSSSQQIEQERLRAIGPSLSPVSFAPLPLRDGASQSSSGKLSPATLRAGDGPTSPITIAPLSGNLAALNAQGTFGVFGRSPPGSSRRSPLLHARDALTGAIDALGLRSNTPKAGEESKAMEIELSPPTGRPIPGRSSRSLVPPPMSLSSVDEWEEVSPPLAAAGAGPSSRSLSSSGFSGQAAPIASQGKPVTPSNPNTFMGQVSNAFWSAIGPISNLKR